MSNKSKCTMFEIRRPEMYILSQKETFYVKLFMKYGKASFLFSMAPILKIAKSGGSINIPGCFHQHSEIVWYQVHLCQMSCFCPGVKMYGLFLYLEPSLIAFCISIKHTIH